MDEFTRRLHAHMAKLLTYQELPVPREACVEGSIEYHKDCVRHLERLAYERRIQAALASVDNPGDE